MYVGLKQPRGDGERYVTPARAAAKETRSYPEHANVLAGSWIMGRLGHKNQLGHL